VRRYAEKQVGYVACSVFLNEVRTWPPCTSTRNLTGSRGLAAQQLHKDMVSEWVLRCPRRHQRPWCPSLASLVTRLPLPSLPNCHARRRTSSCAWSSTRCATTSSPATRPSSAWPWTSSQTVRCRSRGRQRLGAGCGASGAAGSQVQAMGGPPCSSLPAAPCAAALVVAAAGLACRR
jgi:hypothetical protein